jgi:hypothetical protein
MPIEGIVNATARNPRNIFIYKSQIYAPEKAGLISATILRLTNDSECLPRVKKWSADLLLNGEDTALGREVGWSE